MSDVASLELCRTLHELSGWLPERQVGSYYVGGSGHYVKDAIATKDTPLQIPAYDLGYLLRRLQTITDDLTLHWADWWVCKVGGSFDKCAAKADTPEDAACSLAISLFKQGVLK